jgi:beta-ribofuranosylaminobenzene 5'-phosphate synthase
VGASIVPDQAAGVGCVEVCAGARLHLGFLDLTGDCGRRFGSLGLAIKGFDTRVVLRPAETDRAEGAERERTLGLLHRLRAAHGTPGGVAAEIRTAIPAHTGLGSGTQLALGVARAFRTLNGLAPDTRADAAALMRGARSGLGVALFDRGGFVLDGGRGAATDVPPVLAHLRFPPDWRVVLLRDDGAAGAHGEAERAAFAALPAFPAQDSADLCRRALLQVLPGVAEADFAAFGEGVSAMQARLGDYFGPAQGGSRFTSLHVGRVVAALARAGVIGLGQSSWGPTGFVFARDPDEAAHWARLAQRAGDVAVAIHAAREAGAEIHETA